MIARTWPLVEHAREESNAQFLRSMTERMSVLTEANEISRLAVHSLGQQVRAHRCYFFEQSSVDAGKVVVTENWHQADATSLSGDHRVDEFGGPEFWEMVHRGPAEIGDVRQDPRINAAAFEALGIRSYVTVPFRRDGHWIAALAVTSNHPRKWKSSEVQLVENTLARVWPAIERARINSDLRQSVERLNLAIAAAKLGDFHWEAATDRMTLSPRAEEIYDVPPGQSLSRTAMRQKLHPNDRELARQANEHALASHTYYEIEYRLMLPDGSCRWVAATGRGIYDSDGKGIGMRGVVQDITARKEAEEKLREQETLLRAHAAELERRVAERTASLQELVTQMEEFSYSVSHDLRGPLRTMQGYAQILSEDYGAQLDDVAQNYLLRIQRSCTRMEKLTHDVLTYSRVARSEITTEPIDLSKLIPDLVNQYAQLQPPNCELVIREPLLVVRGHEPSLGQAISNLLLNAVKFIGPQQVPRVEISTEKRDASVRIWIKDNGIGIAPDQQRHLFKIFERLPTNGSYEGTGIGLAIVRRAVEKMNGTYGVDSDGVNGSQFWIELPAA